MKQRKNNYLENAIHFEEALHAWASEYLEVEKRWWGGKKKRSRWVRERSREEDVSGFEQMER